MIVISVRKLPQLGADTQKNFFPLLGQELGNSKADTKRTWERVAVLFMGGRRINHGEEEKFSGSLS